jgi:hypothetical protein
MSRSVCTVCCPNTNVALLCFVVPAIRRMLCGIGLLAECLHVSCLTASDPLGEKHTTPLYTSLQVSQAWMIHRAR